MGCRPFRRRSDRVQETRLRDALRRGQRVIREVRPLLRRHPPRAGRTRQTLLDLIETHALGASPRQFVARQRQLGYNPEVMKKAKIAELRNGLSRYLDHVRAGGSVVVYDRDTPIAEIVPIKKSKARNKEELDEERRARLEAKGAIIR